MDTFEVSKNDNFFRSLKKKIRTEFISMWKMIDCSNNLLISF